MKLFEITVTEKEKDMISACLNHMLQIAKNVNNIELSQILDECVFSVEHSKEIIKGEN